MKISADRKQLADALAFVCQAVAPRHVLAALHGVKITAGDSLLLEAFDFETARSVRIDAEIGEPGTVLLPAGVLSAVVADGPTDSVGLDLDGSRVNVRMGRSSYGLATMAADEYPNQPVLPPKVGVISADLLRWAVGMVQHAIARDPKALAPLHGIKFATDEGQLVLTTSERHMVARVAVDFAGEFYALPHGRTLAAAVKSLTGEVDIHTNGRQLALVTPDRAAVVPCIGESFPAGVDRALGRAVDDHPTRVEIDGGELTAALKRLVTVSDQISHVVIDLRDGSALITNHYGEHRGSEEIDATIIGPITLGIDATMLAAVLPSGPVRLGILDPYKPITIHDPARPMLQQVLMPVRLPAGA